MDKDKLKKQIWLTRVSRVNAEKRLKAKENFIQGVNVYYSCIIVIASIFSLLYKDENINLIALLMNISLLVAIIYLNGKKYLENSREYRKNYTELQRLEFEIDFVNDSEKNELEPIYNRYCELIDSSSNHISFDYYKTIHDSTYSEFDNDKKKVRTKYYWNVIYRIIIKIVVLMFPIIIISLVLLVR